MELDAALPIVRALADGVNPITGEAYPEHSPYAEPRTLRALYAAVDLMEKATKGERKRAGKTGPKIGEFTAREKMAIAQALRLYEAVVGANTYSLNSAEADRLIEKLQPKK